jgi:hypothetical protein
VARARFCPPGLKQLAELDAGRASRLTGSTAKAKVELGKDLLGCEIAIGDSLQQVNTPTR